MGLHAYRNLNRRSWSVRDPKQGKRGKVIARPAVVLMKDVVFRVQEGARQTVLRTRRRSVHAYLVGEVLFHGPALAPGDDGPWERFTYNPYRGGSFVLVESQTPLWGAAEVKLEADGTAWARGARC